MLTNASVAIDGTRPQSPAGFQFPELATVQRALASVLCDGPQQDIRVIAREPSIYATTFPSEIITCAFPDGRVLRTYCKYGRAHQSERYGDRRGVLYEGKVYRSVLRHTEPRTATFYGLYVDDEIPDRVILVLEYVSDTVRVNSTPDPEALPLAARWIGAFHRTAGMRLTSETLPFLTRFDESYLLGWAERTSLLAAPLHAEFPWLAPLCKRASAFFEPLLAQPPTVIHGEYYTQNIMYRAGTVFPVDWESAALGAGAIDLASLAIGWPAHIVRNCERAYCEARWPCGAPAEFHQTLDAAHVYLMFRCLGERAEWTTDPGSRWRFDRLADAGTRWGLI